MRDISFADKFLLKYEDHGTHDASVQNGLLRDVRYVVSPNCDARPPERVIDTLVVHNISLPPGEWGGDDVLKFFTNTLDANAHPFYASLGGVRVSSHFYIRRNGELIQFVPCDLRAWHAGDSLWRGRSAVNDFSIGIELEGSDTAFFMKAQYDALAKLTSMLCDRYSIVDIAGHSDIAPGRKTDPGPLFDWENYYFITASL